MVMIGLYELKNEIKIYFISIFDICLKQKLYYILILTIERHKISFTFNIIWKSFILYFIIQLVINFFIDDIHN